MFGKYCNMYLRICMFSYINHTIIYIKAKCLEKLTRSHQWLNLGLIFTCFHVTGGFKDGGVGKKASLSCTTKKRITSNLTKENNQNCQKIKLYGRINEETFIQTGRRGRAGQPGLKGHTARPQWTWVGEVVPGGLDFPHSHVDKLGGTTGEWDKTWVPVQVNKASKTLAVRTCGGFHGRRKSQPHKRAHWRVPPSPRMYTNPPTQKSAPEGPNLFVGSGRSDWKPTGSQASGIVPSLTPPLQVEPQSSALSCPTLANT